MYISVLATVYLQNDAAVCLCKHVLCTSVSVPSATADCLHCHGSPDHEVKVVLDSSAVSHLLLIGFSAGQSLWASFSIA